jgi:biotin carboxyl carrier protein
MPPVAERRTRLRQKGRLLKAATVQPDWEVKIGSASASFTLRSDPNTLFELLRVFLLRRAGSFEIIVSSQDIQKVSITLSTTIETMVGRQSTRMLARQLRAQPCTARSFSSAPLRMAAHNMAMPAMSPTMTEGNIASWKVKEGDSFSTGDILLEIETDKATIDVEAQDDGVMAKIFAQDGEKGVKVGTRIAVLGDPDDDVSSLEIPPDDSKPVESESKESKQEFAPPADEKEAKEAPKKQPAKSSGSPPSGPGQNQKYPLYPSVIALLHANHIPDSDIPKIPATGPQNRLLKGDVLAYLGSISSSYPAEVSKRITHLAHLDLSNIKLLQQQPKAEQPAPSAAAAPPAATTTSVSLPVSLAEVLKVQRRMTDTLGVSVPLATFLARAVDLANDDLPRPKGAKPSSDELFNAVLGLDTIPTTSRGSYLPQISALPTTSFARAAPSRAAKKADIIDYLAGNAIPASRRISTASGASYASPLGGSITTAGGAMNVFSVTVPVGEEKRARTFLERVKTVLQVEPGRLVL